MDNQVTAQVVPLELLILEVVQAVQAVSIIR
jgi:hypothetical protein